MKFIKILLLCAAILNPPVLFAYTIHCPDYNIALPLLHGTVQTLSIAGISWSVASPSPYPHTGRWHSAIAQWVPSQRGITITCHAGPDGASSPSIVGGIYGYKKCTINGNAIGTEPTIVPLNSSIFCSQ